MLKSAQWALALMVVGGLAASPAWAGGRPNWSIGIGIGVPGPGCYRPWGPPCYPYYRPYYPVYLAPPPVIVQPAPVVQHVPVVQPTYSAPTPVHTPTLIPAPASSGAGATTTPAVTTVSASSDRDIDYHLQQLSNADERVRSESVIQLGKLKAARAIDPLAATLSGDRSPTVRECAARALGLIGAVQGLPALRYAAQSDSDRDVRRSAAFAVEVIQSRN